MIEVSSFVLFVLWMEAEIITIVYSHVSRYFEYNVGMNTTICTELWGV